ncbi:hypothetical protein [Streptosporangium carneum]|uniref:Uncharacterized protein n=1 Tax=Streptosporangium carneum TaxID=47481 RepID=A0A9W6MG82_9ACTN|nr:hypothetical protein [Streptosporangium carneum]GLK12643.1 hypothetical protein GCM10017600_60530 [Streptosporangium carneum]
METGGEAKRGHESGNPMLEHGPVGRWRTAIGTAGALFGEEILFTEDGTGLLTTHSVIFGTERSSFRWRMDGPARLRIHLVDSEEDVDRETVVAMEFRSHDSDVGRQTVLAEQGKKGFWLVSDPLERIGDS